MTLTSPSRTHQTSIRRPSGTDSFAAARQLSLAVPKDVAYVQSIIRASRMTAREPWDWYEKLGEVHYALGRAARIAGYATLHLEVLDEQGRWVEGHDPVADDIIAGISSPFGGLRGLLSRYFLLMKVPSDSLLIRIKDSDGYDGYQFLSPSEISQVSLDSLATNTKGQKLEWITARWGANEPDTYTREVDAEDVLGRVWVPSPQYVDMPDSALGALNTECEVLHLSTQSMRAKLMSRFATAGILFVPDNIQNLQVVGQDGAKMSVNGLDYLIKAMSTNVSNWQDAINYLPILMSGPGEVADQIKQVLLDREIFATDIEIRRELIDRIFTGLDIQAQATKGVGQATHWSAWAVSDDELRLVAKPDMQNCCWAMTRLILHAQLAAAGMDPARILKMRIGFDMTAATSKTSLQEDARQVYDRGGLSDDVLREVSGFDEADAPSENERINIVGRQMHNAYLALYVGTIDDIDWDMAQKFGGRTGPAGREGSTPTVGPGVGDPGSPDGGDSDRPKSERPG